LENYFEVSGKNFEKIGYDIIKENIITKQKTHKDFVFFLCFFLQKLLRLIINYYSVFFQGEGDFHTFSKNICKILTKTIINH